MENILLILNIILALILVLLVLMQKSEGGALGIGVSQENFMFSRSAGNFMTKATAFVALPSPVIKGSRKALTKQNLVLCIIIPRAKPKKRKPPLIE